MTEVVLRSLRISSNLDGSGFAAGAEQVAAAQQRMAAGGRTLNVVLGDTQQKVSQAGDPLSRLNRQFVDGYANQARFEAGLRSLNRLLEAGKVSAEAAEVVYQGMAQKLGIVADQARIAEQGFIRLAGVVDTANARMMTAQRTAATPVVVPTGRSANDNVGGIHSVDAGRRQILGYQAFDIGQGVAQGIPLGMIAAQQVPQIAQLYAGQGGLNALWKDSIGILGGVARAAGPWLVAAAGIYGAYRLIASFGQEAALAIDSSTAALAAQAAPLGTVRGQIDELAQLQKTYNDAMVMTGDASTAAADKIIANTQREYAAKKALLKLEGLRQEAALKVNEVELQRQGLALRDDVASVNTRMDLERRGFADYRIGSVPFVRLPDDLTGIERTQEVIDKSPAAKKLKELRAEGELTRLTFERLQDALKATLSDGSLINKPDQRDRISGRPLSNLPVPTLRGVDDMPPDHAQLYRELAAARRETLETTDLSAIFEPGPER